jgi:hypothetical protein
LRRGSVTISIAWVRVIGEDYEELVFASDSRLRFGCAWDCCPKIVTLPRSDSAICFAGDTMHAYPLMLQMRNAIALYSKSRNRQMDIHDLKGHTLRVFNHMREFIHDLPTGDAEPESPDAVFILGGYSWRRKKFVLWVLHYDRNIKAFTYIPIRAWKGVRGKKIIAFTGDREHVYDAKERLRALLRQRKKLSKGGFDMEPFEVLRDMLHNAKGSDTIGGPPQVVKVYQHMNCQSFGVFWPSKDSGGITLLGRPVLGYEFPDCPVLNPDTLKFEAPFSV